MYLSYFDDSGSDGGSDLCVFGGVVIPGDLFMALESVKADAMLRLGFNKPGVEQEEVEFHSHDLYFGGGRFKDVDKQRRREAFLGLVKTLSTRQFPYIYSAIDRKALRKEPLFGSTNPVDLAFRMSLDQLEDWARAKSGPQEPDQISVHFKNMCLVIADECDRLVRSQLQETFRRKWSRRQGPYETKTQLFHLHDSMYFGSSVDSMGLQLADAANWVMRRYLLGERVDSAIAEHIVKAAVCAVPEPAWTQHRGLFRSHVDVNWADFAAENASQIVGDSGV